MGVTLINGDGNNAVYASQDADWFAAMTGQQTTILDVNQNLAYEVADDNHIVIKSGVLVTKEGRRVQIDVGETVNIVIPSGTQNVTRYYIIGFKLKTNGSGNQIAEGFCQLMDSATATIDEDMFKEGATEIFISLYRVIQVGLSIDTVASLIAKRNSYPSHIGMIIQSTTLNTEDKVKALYGGTKWISHTGYILRGATSGVVANQAVKSGGADSVTLSINQIPAHGHSVNALAASVEQQGAHRHFSFANSNSAADLTTWDVPSKLRQYPGESYPYRIAGAPLSAYDASMGLTSENGAHSHSVIVPAHNTNNAGGGQPIATVPNYKSVYIWERTE